MIVSGCLALGWKFRQQTFQNNICPLIYNFCSTSADFPAAVIDKTAPDDLADWASDPDLTICPLVKNLTDFPDSCRSAVPPAIPEVVLVPVPIAFPIGSPGQFLDCDSEFFS